MKTPSSTAVARDTIRALAFERGIRQRQYATQVQLGIVEGTWDDPTWNYQGQSILFVHLRDRDGQITNRRRTARTDKPALTGIAATIARTAAGKVIEEGGSLTSVRHRVTAVRILDDIFRSKDERWLGLSKQDFNEASKFIEMLPL